MERLISPLPLLARGVRRLLLQGKWLAQERYLSLRYRGRRVFENPFPVCRCIRACSHDVGIHSYAEAYQAVLDAVRPGKVFEWGPGRNSAMAIAAGAEVFAVEFDPRYVPDLPKGSFHCFMVPIDDPEEFAGLRGVTDAEIYFVDSRHRQRCLRNILLQAREDAVVCLHDAQRLRYQVVLREFPYVKFLERGFCIASRSPEVMKIGGR